MESNLANESNQQGSDPEVTGVQATPGQSAGLAAPAPAATRSEEDAEHNSGWWLESTDGQCSQNGALFAESQSAPLNVV